MFLALWLFLNLKGYSYHYKNGILKVFSLKIDYKEKKVKLLIYNYNKELIDDYSYWSFDSVELALNRKFKNLAIIEAWDKKINNQKYYKYWKINIYKLKSFDEFIKYLEKGKIKIIFNYGTYKSGIKKGEMHNHGTIFSINKEGSYYITLLFLIIPTLRPGIFRRVM